MIYPVNVSIGEFECLIDKPFSWQRIVDISVGLVKGDKIKVIEVDSSDLPTGREMIGIIKFLSSGDLVINNNEAILVYCENVSEGLGFGSIGSSIIVL